MGCCSSSEKKPGGAKPEAKNQRLEARRKLLNEGKAGALGVGLDGNMVVGSVSNNSGLKKGDFVVMVKTTEQDDDFDDNDKEDTPVRTRKEFLTAAGPRRDMFEGCVLPITVIRDPAKQEAFRAKCGKLSKKDYLKEVAKPEYGAQTFDVRFGPETQQVRQTRVKKITDIKNSKGLAKLDVDFAVNIMSDPRPARIYARKVFSEADKDNSKSLSLDEVVGVFTELAEAIGCKVPSKGSIKDLTKFMDTNKSGHVTFDEFFPVFRWKMIGLISEMLDD